MALTLLGFLLAVQPRGKRSRPLRELRALRGYKRFEHSFLPRSTLRNAEGRIDSYSPGNFFKNPTITSGGDYGSIVIGF
jgi:hypothetical protein